MDFLGGKLLVSPLLQTPLPIPVGGLVLSYTVPSGICQTFYLEALQLDSAAARGVSMSQGSKFTLGN